jgi:hypothetical protein
VCDEHLAAYVAAFRYVLATLRSSIQDYTKAAAPQL